MEFLYRVTNEDEAIFGANWCGPKRYDHGVETLVARYEKEEGGDGQTAEVYCSAFPATFYRVKVLAGSDSIGQPKAAYEVGTGSGFHMAEVAAQIAEHIAGGMLGFHPSNAEAHASATEERR